MQGLLRFGEKYGNERLEELLRRLDSPHKEFPAIHVAGTKGKGSTTTFASSILRAGGFRTGSYLSPYVYDLRERIQINGEMIPKDDFARIVTRIKPHIETVSDTPLGHTTEFELKTAVAFCWFAEQKVDCAVLEVGLGGRLDATNVIPPPLVAVITNIGFDHVELLGDTLEQIAGEKAGIIKSGSICVTGIEGGPALNRVVEVCREKAVPLSHVQAGREWWIESDRSLGIKTARRRLSNLHLSMRGQYQFANAAIALWAVDSSPYIIDDNRVREGLEHAIAPGRFEVVQEADPTIVLDAAHNELAAQVLTDSLIKDLSAHERPVVLVVGMSHRHEPIELLTPLLGGLKPELFLATEPSFRPRPAAELADTAAQIGVKKVEVSIPATAAARRAVEAARRLDNALVLVTGSFFTVGDLPPDFWRQEPLPL